MEIINALYEHERKKPLSFHVPGHKNGELFRGEELFGNIGAYDVTELNHLDDLYDPSDFLERALTKTKKIYMSDESYFLVNGSTVGNLVSILATVKRGDKVYVQRNCHKSIFHGLELAGALPIILPVEICAKTNAAVGIDVKKCEKIIEEGDGTVLILTYPNYYGHTVPIADIIKTAHNNNITVIVDEAHGAHFQLPFKSIPQSSLQLGADLVIQSAHKTLPALTMGSFLHIKTKRVSQQKVEKYLHILQTSSPSYLIMASLNYAVDYVTDYKNEPEEEILEGIQAIHEAIESHPMLHVVMSDYETDPFKIAVKANGVSGYQLQSMFDKEAIYTEMANETTVLFVIGLMRKQEMLALANELANRLANIKMKAAQDDGPTKVPPLYQEKTYFPFSYDELEGKETIEIAIEDSVGYIAAKHVIPYPPGIPLPMKGEIITNFQVEYIHKTLQHGGKVQGIQHKNKITVYKKEL